MSGGLLGDYVLRSALSEDAFGTLHRAVRVEEGRFLRHALVRSYPEARIRMAVSARVPEATNLDIHLGEPKGVMPHCRIYPKPEPFVTYDYLPGRTLAQVVRASREQGLPLGLEHTLTVLRDLALTLDLLHDKGLEQGMLLPELVWVTFEGAVLWLDVPFMGLYRELDPGPAASADLKAGWARDFRQLAHLGWHMLSGDAGPLPDGEAWHRRLEAWSDESGQGLDARLKTLFRRMVGLERPFPDRTTFHQEAGELLRGGILEPSTFNLSLLMHTLFRQAIDQETRAMAAERIALYEPSRPEPRPSAPQAPERREGRTRSRWGLVAAALLLMGGSGGMLYRQRSEESQSLRQALAHAERREAELVQAAADAARKQAPPPPAEPPAAPPPEAPNKASSEADVAGPVAASSRPAEAPRPEPRPAAPAGGNGGAVLLHAEALGQSGRARLKVYVNEEGRALRVMVLESSSPAAAEAAQQAALKASYRPAWRDGRPSRDWVEVVLAR